MIVYGSGESGTGRQPSPSEAIIDSQSIKSAAMLSQDVGFDGERFMDANDFERRYLGVGTTFVTAANVGERGGKRVLKRVNQMGKQSLVCTRFGSMVGLTVSHSCGG